MADVTTVFAAKDESFAKTVDKLQGRLSGFQGATASFSEKVGGMASAFARFAGPIAAMGAAFLGTRSAVQSFTDAINVGGQLAELSQRTGESAGNLAILQRAFTNAGSSGEAVGPMLNRLQRFMVEGANGGKAQSEAMSKLGMSFSDLAGKTPLEQMQLLAQRISALPDPAQRSAAAMEIFGRSGGELLPLLRNMGGEIDTARAQLGSYPAAVDRAAKALDGIGDNFAAITTKAREFVTGALVNIAPQLEKALETIGKIDFTALGMKLSDAFAKAFDFFRGLWENPSQIFGLIGDYLNATFRQAGDSLVSAFLTAGNALSNFLNELVSRGAFSQLGDVLANAFWFGASKFNLAMFDAIESVINFFGNLWNSVTGQGVQGLATKLLDVVKFFASDFVQAMTNPAGFIANKLSSALMGATKSASDEYRYAFDSATGSYIEKARAGLDAVVTGSGDRLRQSASDFGSTLVDSASAAAASTEIVKVNLFGGAEAIAAVNDRVSAIAAAGAQFREPLEASVAPAEQIAQSLGTIPASSLSLQDALNNSFPLAAAIKTEAQSMAQQGQMFASSVGSAKVDAQITANVFAGLSDRMSSAVNSTSAMLDQMRESFHFGRQTSEEVYAKLREGGMNINEATQAAADYASQQNQADSDLMSAENKVRIAENQRDRAHERADRMEKAGQERSAHELRMRANAEFTKKLEDLRPMLEKATENARKLLEAGGETAGKKLDDAGQISGDKLVSGATIAAERLANAVGAGKTNESAPVDTFTFTELIYKFLNQTFDDFKKRVPQHALS